MKWQKLLLLLVLIPALCFAQFGTENRTIHFQVVSDTTQIDKTDGFCYKYGEKYYVADGSRLIDIMTGGGIVYNDLIVDTLTVQKYFYQQEIGVVDSATYWVSTTGDTLKLSMDQADLYAIDLQMNTLGSDVHFFTIDTLGTVDINKTGDVSLRIHDKANIAHGRTSLAPTDVYLYIDKVSGASGGASLYGLSEAGSIVGMMLTGVSGGNPTTGAVTFRAAKANGVGWQNISGTDRGFDWINKDGTVLATILGNGYMGIGTASPDRIFHAEVDDATATAVSQVMRLTHTTSGTPGNGIGSGLEFESETSANNNEILGTIEVYAPNAGAGSEYGTALFKTMVSGAAATERLRLSGYGCVFNEDSYDVDFRIESNDDANMFFVDAGNNRIGIGTSAPDKAVEINSATGANLRLSYNAPSGSATYYTDFGATNAGNLNIDPVGGSVAVRYNATTDNFTALATSTGCVVNVRDNAGTGLITLDARTGSLVVAKIQASGAKEGLWIDGNATTGNLFEAINDVDDLGDAGTPGDSSLVLDKLANLGLGVVPVQRLHTNGDVRIQRLNTVGQYVELSNNSGGAALGFVSASAKDFNFNIGTGNTLLFNNGATGVLKLMPTTGNVLIGNSTVADQQSPDFIIYGDADSDGTAITTEALSFSLKSLADPATAFWQIKSTQSLGYEFDKAIYVKNSSTLDADSCVKAVVTGGDGYLYTYADDGDNISMYHTGVDGYIKSSSGYIGLTASSANFYWTGNFIYAGVSNTKDIGSAVDIWRTGYLGTLTLGDDSDDVSGQLNWIASDNDLGNMAITTADQLTINDFSGGVFVISDQASNGILGLYADDGDDPADKWEVIAIDGGNLKIASFATSSWVDVLELTNAGALQIDAGLTMAGAISGATSISAASGFSLDITGTGNSYVEIIQDNNAGYLAIGRTTATEGSMLSITDGGADNLQGMLQIYNDGGVPLYWFPSTANEFRVRTSAPTDDDADGYVIIDMDDGTIGASTQPVTASTVTMSSYLYHSTQAGITATFPGGQGDSPLTKTVNEVATVGTADDAVTLPAAEAGKVCIIINNGANQLEIWPASGDNAGGGVDTAITLAAGENLHLVAYDATNWEQL